MNELSFIRFATFQISTRWAERMWQITRSPWVAHEMDQEMAPQTNHSLTLPPHVS